MKATAPTVLVVEDEALVRLITVELILAMGYRVLEAANGADALATLQRELDIKLLFTDIKMPGIDGFALAKRAKMLRADLKVIYATGYTDQLCRGRSDLEGPIIGKPYRPDQLQAEIFRALAA